MLGPVIGRVPGQQRRRLGLRWLPALVALFVGIAAFTAIGCHTTDHSTTVAEADIPGGTETPDDHHEAQSCTSIPQAVTDAINGDSGAEAQPSTAARVVETAKLLPPPGLTPRAPSLAQLCLFRT